MLTALVQVDPVLGVPLRAVKLQFNPEKLSRTVEASTGSDGDGSHGGGGGALRLRGPARETIRFEAELDLLSEPGLESLPEVRARLGVAPPLAVLESMLSPTAAQLGAHHLLASLGTLEVAPMESALIVLVIGPSRVLPVRLTELSIEEQFFDAAMTPIRARVSLSLRVLTVADLGFGHPGAALFLASLVRREALAATGAAETGVAFLRGVLP